MRKKILFFTAEDWTFCSHRLPLAVAAKRRGYDVVVVTNVQSKAMQIESEGLKLIHLNCNRRSLNPLKAIITLLDLIKIFKFEKPQLIHQVAMKPILLGILAAKFAKVKPTINAITGMGYVFVSNRLKVRILRSWIIIWLRVMLRGRATRVIFQNPDELRWMLDKRIISEDQAILIRGAGVNEHEFIDIEEDFQLKPLVVFPGRLLRDKGVFDFIDAARILASGNVEARFALVGEPDPFSRGSISDMTLQELQEEGVVEIWGKRENMPAVFRQASIVCLPSYREGLPKALLEAASCARPIVTTDAIGCREVVKHGENGYLVPLRSKNELADALKKLIENPNLRTKMGRKGRKMVIRNFTLDKVVAETLAIYDELS